MWPERMVRSATHPWRTILSSARLPCAWLWQLPLAFGSGQNCLLRCGAWWASTPLQEPYARVRLRSSLSYL
eukprot:7388975-Prymnesium_polylepis.3